jgi:hypothetical protein
MSGNNIDLKFEHRSMPLLVALHRWAAMWHNPRNDHE